MAVAAVSTPSLVRSSRCLDSTLAIKAKKVSLRIRHGASSSNFFSSDTPLSLEALGMKHHKPSIKSFFVQANQSYPQNEDLPFTRRSKNEKKPFVRPIQHGSHAKRMRRRERMLLPRKPLKAPANGLVVQRLVPLAHMTYKAYQVVKDGVARLLKHIPVKACRWCPEIHVGKVGHHIKTCQGKGATGRGGEHFWIPGYLDDVLVPIEAFHLEDRLQKPIKHEERFKHERIPAIVELCIQAGLDLPEFPTVRRTVPVDAPVGFDEEEEVESETKVSGDGELDDGSGDESTSATDVVTIDEGDDVKTIAEKTLRAWGKMRYGADQLMRVYPVRACGYCPEVHIGRRGHKIQLCGAFKHQWRNGQHGWQDAALNDLIPASYVWHVRDMDEPALKHKLAKYYGQAPAIIELCVQAGAQIPPKHRAGTRLDVIIPDVDELEMVA